MLFASVEENIRRYATGRRLLLLLLLSIIVTRLVYTQDLALLNKKMIVVPTNKCDKQDGIYMTFVVATRMDGNYAGDSTNRFKRCITVLLEQLHVITSETGKRAEIIVVEWEPVPGNERVHDLLRNLYSLADDGPENHRMTQVRVITVPSSVAVAHNLDHFMEFHAKNVAIRRARGQWTVTFNQDALFPMKLLKVMFATNGNTALHPNCFYRTTLVEFNDGANRINTAGLIRTKVAGLQKGTDRKQALADADTLTKWAKLQHPFAHDACRLSCDIDDEEETQNNLHPDIYSAPFRENCRVLDYQSSGDFELATTQAWHTVGGFLESKGNNHVDSYQLVRFRSHGYEQVVLDHGCYILHQSHPSGRSDRRDGIDSWALVHKFERCIEERTRAMRQQPNVTHIAEPPQWCGPAENKYEFGYLHHHFEEHYLQSVL